MQHLDEGTIHSWLDGALGGEEAARVEAHVNECQECAAAVAEARGFIAASSRILTALDNAPRGVIPAALPKRRVDPLVWRIAATVLVVAAGTLAVVQNRGSDKRPRPIAADIAPLSPHLTPDERAAATAQASAQASHGPTTAAQIATVPTGRAAAITEAAPGTAAGKTPSIDLSKSAVVGNQRADVNARQSRGLAAGTTASINQQNAASSGYAAAAPAAPEVAPSRAAAGVDMDAAEPERLKVVGSPPRIGLKVTLYEVAPGDTVTLTEPMALSLSGVVVTGAGEVQKRAVRAMAPPSVERADAVTAAAPDSQHPAALLSAPVSTRAPSAPTPVKQVEVANGVTTISWADATTGNVLKLSGRMPEARLQQIKIRIERERAAAAKKNP